METGAKGGWRAGPMAQKQRGVLVDANQILWPCTGWKVIEAEVPAEEYMWEVWVRNRLWVYVG